MFLSGPVSSGPRPLSGKVSSSVKTESERVGKGKTEKGNNRDPEDRRESGKRVGTQEGRDGVVEEETGRGGRDV